MFNQKQMHIPQQIPNLRLDSINFFFLSKQIYNAGDFQVHTHSKGSFT